MLKIFDPENFFRCAQACRPKSVFYRMEWKSERPCEVYAHSSNSGHMLTGLVDQHVVILCPTLHLYNEAAPCQHNVVGLLQLAWS